MAIMISRPEPFDDHTTTMYEHSSEVTIKLKKEVFKQYLNNFQRKVFKGHSSRVSSK
jgi:hypothetical protein